MAQSGKRFLFKVAIFLETAKTEAKISVEMKILRYLCFSFYDLFWVVAN